MSDDLTDYERLREDLNLDEDYKDKSILRLLYIEENMTQEEINDLFGLGGSGIQYWLNKFDINKDISAYREDPPVPEEKIYSMYWEEGMSQSEIGRKVGYSQATVAGWMEYYSIDTRGPEGNPEPPASEEKLRELYVDDGKGTRPIAKELGCSRNTVSRWIDRFGIEKHSPGNQVRTEDLVDEVEEMYRDGYSQEQISKEFEVKQTTVSNWLRGRGVEIRNKAGFGSVQITKRGEKVKSTYEKFVADKLYEFEIDYVYEPNLDCVKYVPDFMVHGDIVEVWGVKNDEQYDSRRENKVSAYDRNGYTVFSVFPSSIEEDTMGVVENV